MSKDETPVANERKATLDRIEANTQRLEFARKLPELLFNLGVLVASSQSGKVSCGFRAAHTAHGIAQPGSMWFVVEGFDHSLHLNSTEDEYEYVFSEVNDILRDEAVARQERVVAEVALARLSPEEARCLKKFIGVFPE